eukprot:TRINITY_DN9252_c0_g2_i1.p1 TRINITY_DN9252_c0_g2~~TRINITY_DN9252_c0_g2_i1.p1  ORF type:complete len:328 (-),score=100.62 TRINITY_DN9252_c0_g2_i1:30-944(-)
MERQIRRDWDAMIGPIAEAHAQLAGASIDDYMWALSNIWSRAFCYTRDNGDEQRCLVPVINAANHDPTAAGDLADIVHYDSAQRCFRLTAGRAYANGEQFFILYGRYSNAKLLYTYGFALPHNPHCGVDFWVNVSAVDANADAKRRLLQGHDLTATQTYDFRGTIRRLPGGRVVLTAALLATARVIQLSADELQLQGGDAAAAERAFTGEVVTLRNEMATYGALKSVLERKCGGYAVEVGGDGVEVGDEAAALPYRRRMAHVVVAGELQLLRDAIEVLAAEAKALSESAGGFVPMDHPTRHRTI